MTSEKKKILIIDDEVGIVEELKDYLSEEGFNVQTAVDGKAGMELLESFGPDLVITDLKLPDISGIEILKKARTDYPHMRVVVSTGYVDQSLIDEAENFGRDSFIQKPFDLEAIRKEVDKLV